MDNEITDAPLRLHDNKPIYTRELYKKRKDFHDPDFVRSISRAVRGQRESLGWTLADTAKAAGVLSPSVNRLENGSINGLHFDVVLRIVKALGLEIRLV